MSIDELLNKYFDGKTSLDEEDTLRAYFSGGKVQPHHQIYIPMFKTFISEKKLRAPISVKQNHSKSTRIKWLWGLVGSVAAVTILIFALHLESASGSYMIVHGKRINNSELAETYANKKLQRSLTIIQKDMEPYKKVEKIQKRLKKIEAQLLIND